MIGLDGLEPSLVGALLAAGELPNLARLVSGGGLARVATTYPAQTPVAWSTFATGTNPGGHGIFDFLRRDPRTYLPDSGLNRYEQKNPLLPPRAVNQRRGTPVWERLSEAGVTSTVLRCPCTYPPDRPRGRMLSGMGVPDLRGGFGTGTFYSSDESVAARESENVVRVQGEGDGSVATYLVGPRHPRTRADCRFDITLSPDPARRMLIARSGGSPREFEVREGEWSGWLRVNFRLGPLQSVHGIVRFFLVRIEPTLEFYASPINFDPETPLFPISSPPDYARQLSGTLGPFYTAGMVEDHNGLMNERFGEDAFLAQCDDAWREREAMMLHELDRFDEGLFYCLFDTPDRVQHMLWRFREPEHPANRGRAPDPAFRRAIEEHYRRGDEVVGRVLESVDDRTLLIVLSDHGFGSFRRGFHLNKWLLDRGLLALKAGLEPGPDSGDLLRGVDWDRTRAYAIGLSGLYLNLQGREGRGAVRPEDAEELKTTIARELNRLEDPQEGVVAVRSALTREQVYAGPFVHEAPDLILNYARGYRVSWSSSLGGVAAGGPFEDNTRKWSGDHIIDPALVPGVLLMNRPFRGEGPRLVDLAPTILAALGLPIGDTWEGRSLLS
ncbi:alkaline phosphatase family protein [Tautonia plasticadhaerens]|uniref:Type I phosphodiesterase / nucleotide pyrophosphatase n=1 Tax=Tautonia plasticadhaerens TaxID=2527974 RepID=A0A518H9W5_9BACT|nr:alkaline phosphatase family protein [Tautonia plasticadhaerens]QDV37642.1 Type I phosphodiesterase / nucleotide pyrophosphatase [Tautonia plasticadhaerens]